MSWRWGGICLIGLCFGLVIAGAQRPQAATSTFMIRPELPSDNRVGQTAGYFDLKALPQRRDIAVRVFNPASTKLKINVALLQGENATNGALHYRITPKSSQQLLRYPRSITLAAKTATQIRFSLPDRAMIGAGTKLFAIQLTSNPTANADVVVNRVRYRVGLVLRGQSITSIRRAKLIAHSRRVKLAKPKLTLTLQNLDPLFLESVKIKTTLQHARWRWLNYQQTRAGLKWAPDSRLSTRMTFPGQHLQPGIYAVRLAIKSDQWHQVLTRYLQVHKDGLISWTDRAAYNRAQHEWWWLVAGVVLLGSAGGYWQWQRRKRHA